MSRCDQIQCLRFDFEAELFQSLVDEPSIRSHVGSEVQYNLHKRYMLGTSVKITEDMFPDLHGIYQGCLKHIGNDVSGDLFVHQSSDFNAQVSADGGRFDILLTSALVKELQPMEVAFVIGHELGHVLFRHNQIPVNRFLSANNAHPIPSGLSNRLISWSRASEISADRVGMLTCGDLSSAANAFLKIASGLSFRDSQAVVRTLHAQFDEILQITRRTRNKGVSLYTHPLIPIRFKSLEMIALDILAFRNTGSSINVRDLKHINWEIKSILFDAEPVDVAVHQGSQEGSGPLGSGQEVSGLFVLCLLVVAVSEGPLQTPKVHFIRHVVDQSEGCVNLDEILEECYRDPEMFCSKALTEISDCHVSQDELFSILHFCASMCRTYGGIGRKNLETMKTICTALGGSKALWHAVVESPPA